MDTAQVSTPIAGWYEDPQDATQIRYWNGTAWTESVQPRPDLVQAPPVAEAATPPAVAPTAPTPPAPSTTQPGAGVIPPNFGLVASDPERDKIRTAVIIAGVVLVIAIGGAFLLLSGRDSSGSGSSLPPGPTPTLDEAKTVDARAAEQARTAQTAIETFSTDNNGSYLGATADDLRKIESTLATADSLEVTSDKTTYTVGITSDTGDVLSIRRNADGTLQYICNMPGTGICPSDGFWN